MRLGLVYTILDTCGMKDMLITLRPKLKPHKNIQEAAEAVENLEKELLLVVIVSIIGFVLAGVVLAGILKAAFSLSSASDESLISLISLAWSQALGEHTQLPHAQTQSLKSSLVC